MDRIVALLDAALARPLGSAAAVSIGDAGSEVLRVVRGHAARVPVLGPEIDELAWFDLASLTKPMVTAACAMVLVGEGQLDLDAPLTRWHGQAQSTGTVRHLLGHAAGYPAHVEFFRELAGGAARDPYRALVALAERVAASPPGVSTVYSDVGYILLGDIVERTSGRPLAQAFGELVADPLELTARFPGTEPLAGAVATELDDRGLVCGRVHDENAYHGGGIAGHAGLFATIGDVARFAAAITKVHAGTVCGRLRPEVVQRFVRESAAPASTWRLGWDTPSATIGTSHAGDRWPRDHAIGHGGFTGTSMWLDLARGRWVILLTNRVHPSREGQTADRIKELRRAIADAALELLEA